MRIILTVCTLLSIGGSIAVKFREYFYMLVKIFVVIIHFSSFFQTAADVAKCQKGDGDCIVQSANKMLQTYPKGIKRQSRKY